MEETMLNVTMKTAILLGERTEAPTTKDGKPWKHDAFTVTLECEGRTLETPWKQGIGNRVDASGKPMAHRTDVTSVAGMYWSERAGKWIAGKPRAPKSEDVLSSLLMDASDTGETFEDWCGTFGEDTDSRRALALYLLLQENAKKLRVFLGMSAADAVEKFGEGDAEKAAAVLCGTSPVTAS